VPVEVRALRANATAPFAKTNISKIEIAKQNTGQDLPFLLNQTPSVIINSDAGNGVGYTGIRIRGSDATRINVTLNGVPFNDAESGGAFFVDLPDFVSSVNSIQVQRGVGTSSNGPGAFGATINLSTNEVSRTRYLELNNTVGSFHTIKNTIKGGSGLIGNHFTADVRLSSITSDGYIDRASSNLQSLYFSTAYLNHKTTVRFNAFVGKEKTYQAWYGISESDLKKSRTTNYAGTERSGEPYDDETDNFIQKNYQLFFTQTFSPKLVFNTGLFYVKGKGYYEQYKGGENYDDYHLMKPVYGQDTISMTDLVRQLWLDNDFYGDIFSLQYNSITTQLTLGGSVSNYKGRHFGEVVWAQNGLGGNTRWYNVDAKKKDYNI
jgi:iron complex outermembrane receptor protein